mgnify:CR=1 FL=1
MVMKMTAMATMCVFECRFLYLATMLVICTFTVECLSAPASTKLLKAEHSGSQNDINMDLMRKIDDLTAKLEEMVN